MKLIRKINIFFLALILILMVSGCDELKDMDFGEEEIESAVNVEAKETSGELDASDEAEQEEENSIDEPAVDESESSNNEVKDNSDELSLGVEDLAVTTGDGTLDSLRAILTVTDYNYEEEAINILNEADIYAMVNKKNSLTREYVPEDLIVPDIAFSFSGDSDKRKMRQVAGQALHDLFEAAKLDGVNLYAVSGYRSYNTQESIFTYFANKDGEEAANKYSARPGESEHQTGLAMDVSAQSVGNGLKTALGEKVEGIWMAENAHLYGFIIRYPEGKTDITGYKYEPWHLRYIGKEIAAYIYENDLTLEEFYQLF